MSKYGVNGEKIGDGLGENKKVTVACMEVRPLEIQLEQDNNLSKAVADFINNQEDIVYQTEQYIAVRAFNGKEEVKKK